VGHVRRAIIEEPRGVPVVSVIKREPEFAHDYAKQDVDKYKAIVSDIATALLDRDTAPGAQPEDLLGMDIPALIVPGRDESHATSAARYLEECLPKSQYWDVLPEQQTEACAPARVAEFLGSAK